MSTFKTHIIFYSFKKSHLTYLMYQLDCLLDFMKVNTVFLHTLNPQIKLSTIYVIKEMMALQQIVIINRDQEKETLITMDQFVTQHITCLNVWKCFQRHLLEFLEMFSKAPNLHRQPKTNCSLRFFSCWYDALYWK